MLKPRRYWDLYTLLVVALGVAIRFYAGWTARLLPWRDSAVVMRMSRHMASGEPMPVFYYGQAYMGSLEAWMGSLTIRVFGDSPFAAALGTILPGCAVLLLTVWIGRRIAGERGGFFTALMMMAMSGGALYLSVHPRGGYMVMLLCGLLTLHWGVEGLKRSGSGGFNWRLAACGFCGGLGWWTLQLVVMFFIPVVVLALPKWRDLLREKALPAAVLAFLLGGLPWWVWNASQGWESLSMTQTVGKVSLSEGGRLFWERLSLILGYGFAPAGVGIVQFLGCLLLILLVAGVLFHGFLQIRHAEHRPWQGLFGHLLVPVAVFLIYTSSYFATFDTPRYLLPLVPSVAIVCGAGLSWLSVRGRWGIGLAALAALWVQPWDTWRLGTWLDWMPENRQAVEDARSLGQVLNTVSDGEALGHPIEAWWSGYFSGPDTVVADYPFDIYAPDNRRMEQNGIRSVVDNYLGVESFLHSTRTAYRKETVGRFMLYTDFRPLRPAWDWLPDEQIEGVWQNGADRRDVLSDGNLDTRLVIEKTERSVELDWRFAGSPRLCGLTLPHALDIPEDRMTLTAVLADGREKVLMRGAPRYAFFWSGDRMLRGGEGMHQQLWFTVPETGATAVRVRLEIPPEVSVEARELSEVMWMVQAEADADPVEADLSALTEKVDGGVLFAPRWMRTELAHVSGKVDVRLPSWWNRGVNDLPREDEVHPPLLPLIGPVWLILHERDVPRSREVAAAVEVTLEEAVQRGPWGLFKAVPQSEENYLDYLPLYWTEFGLMSSTGTQYRRFERARAIMDSPGAEELNHFARDLAPEMVGLSDPAVPMIEVDAVFEDGLALRGMDWEWDGAQRLLTMDWHWVVPAEFPLRRWSLFVHVQQQGKTLFQDDHNPGHEVLPWVAEPAAVDRYVTVTRKVRVPEGVGGPLEVKAGWLDPGTGERIRVRSDAQVDKGTVQFSGVTLQAE